MRTESQKRGARKYAQSQKGKAKMAAYREEHRAEAAKRRSTRQTELQKKVNALKAAPCMDCGNTFPPICMQYDHRRGTKRGYVSSLVWRNCSWETILAEIAKCDLVCANCHSIRTENDRRII